MYSRLVHRAPGLLTIGLALTAALAVPIASALEAPPQISSAEPKGHSTTMRRLPDSAQRSTSAQVGGAFQGVDRLVARRPPAPPTLNPTRIEKDVRWLAGDALRGRGLGMTELDRAADYLAGQLKDAGLPGGMQDGSYFQPFEIATDVTLGAANRLEALVNGASVSLKLGEDYQPLGFSDSNAVEGQVAFAGYGITAPDLKYDDFEGIDVKDRIVLILRGIPGGKPSGAFLAPGSERFGQLRYKALNAREHGAKAVLFVDRQDGEELIPLPHGHITSASGITAAHIKRASVDRLLQSIPTRPSIQTLQSGIDAKLSPGSSQLTGLNLKLEVSLEKKTGATRNVVARLEGADEKLKNEYIVIGAHYDHLGLGGESSLAPEQLGQIHHGADDNASGTAGVLELARYFARAPRLPRTLIFVCFSAEEVGLGGSSHYVKAPVAPLEQTVLMVNLDMIGRLRDNKIYVQGVDTAEGLREMLAPVAESLKLQASFTGDGYGPSDHTPFYAKGIPVLFFFTGAHADYHRPSDTADKLNSAGETAVLRMVSGAVETVGKKAERPKAVRLSSAPAPDPGGGGGRHGYGPYLGTIPDFTETPGGVALTGVRPGSPAEQAGIQGGDVMIRFGGKNVENLHDFTYALQEHRPGDVVEIVVKREGKELSVQATLGKRP